MVCRVVERAGGCNDVFPKRKKWTERRTTNKAA